MIYNNIQLSILGNQLPKPDCKREKIPLSIRPVLKARPFRFHRVSLFLCFFISLFLCLFLCFFIQSNCTYTFGTLQVHFSSIWVSTALATFACKRKPLTVYLSFNFAERLLLKIPGNQSIFCLWPIQKHLHLAIPDRV